ncbi:Protein of unknown function DUF4786 [Cinara cedri]|uniref:Uncharacterized protein n=1 Tax=Cinara cedri TaxID=506608 RepID=A0A5E4M2H9_9HEMI|nr:Protein of unknown function DUF4786 [Cinara cedri]
MDLTYLVFAVLGMFAVVRPCRPLPTVTAAAAAAAAFPTPTPSRVAAAAEPPANNNNKRSRSLQFQQPQSPYHHLHGGGIDLQQYNDVIDDLPSMYLHHQQQQQLLRQQNRDDDDDGDGGREDNDLLRLSGRARPAKPDSPMYFIRLPPQPYMYVPGYGYVSQPTRLEPPPFTQRPHSPFLDLPLSPYVFNGRPAAEVFLLQNAYDNLYSEVLQNIYP